MKITTECLVEELGRKGFAPKPKPNGGFRALCPAHDDHNPSLDIDPGDNGSPLVICRSCGAKYHAVIQALGIDRNGSAATDGKPTSKAKTPGTNGKPTNGREAAGANGKPSGFGTLDLAIKWKAGKEKARVALEVV